jgi:hypothetical protein
MGWLVDDDSSSMAKAGFQTGQRLQGGGLLLRRIKEAAWRLSHYARAGQF